jgi:hypothetical protein
VEPEGGKLPDLIGDLPAHLVPSAIVGLAVAQFPRPANGGEISDRHKQFSHEPAGGYLTPFAELVEALTDLICAAQEYVRELSGGERCAASLRDVQRCIKVYGWFGSHFALVDGGGAGAGAASKLDFLAAAPAARPHIARAAVLSLAFCYQARLPREQRLGLRQRLFAQQQRGGLARVAEFLAFTPASFAQTVETVQRSFVSQMNLGEGIALNEALCENLFMILVSVLNEIPIFLIGKPGSSKSLAMRLLQENLNGSLSANSFLRGLPAVEVFSYQCSPLSTSHGIEQTVTQARRFKRASVNTVVVVLLDEVGLAEQSPHLPLKVLHKVFDTAEAGESVVGISNWGLDPAKMNRAVHLFRPAPTTEDLAITAEGMVSNAQVKGHPPPPALLLRPPPFPDATIQPLTADHYPLRRSRATCATSPPPTTSATRRSKTRASTPISGACASSTPPSSSSAARSRPRAPRSPPSWFSRPCCGTSAAFRPRAAP